MRKMIGRNPCLSLADPLIQRQAMAIQVHASECESRQQWGEAARCFLSGQEHNTMDRAMEHGFQVLGSAAHKCLCTHILNRQHRCKHFLTHRVQTNIDLLRASRARCVERPPQSRWNGILSFKAGSKQQRSRAPEEQDPWKRLGAKYEELLSDPGYIHDLLHDRGADFIEEQRAEFRRIIFLVPRVHLN